MTLTELFETFRESAFRLEVLQRYVLEEDEPRRQAFREGRPLPPRPGKIESMRLVRKAVAAGKRVHRVHRVHVVELPLTEYLRYELAVYRENIAAGEDVRISDRAAHRGLRELDTDFWLFDAEAERPAVVWFRYTPDGRILGRDYSDDLEDIRRARAHRDLAVAQSLSLDEFLALPGVR